MGGLTFGGEGINVWCGGLTYMYYTYRYIKGTLPTDFYIQWRSSVYITYIMCPSGHLTSARFEHFVCHRYIWYIFSLVCSVFVIQYIYHIMNMFNQVQWWKKYLSKEYVSLNIKHTCSWRNKFVVYIYIIYIENLQNLLKITKCPFFILTASKNIKTQDWGWFFL